ncbi:Rv3235 family protein [Streptosporangium soli]|nr:Rv3235 family protein [Streptosporangium sp. KLBMP 9127]
MSRHLRPVSLPRFAPAPAVDPPYDDERAPADQPPAPPYIQGSLALAYDEIGPAADSWVRSMGPAPDERRLRALGQAFAEILAGRRLARTVAAHTTERAYAGLLRAGKIIDADRPPFASVPHVSRPADGVIEMCLLVHCGRRPRVLAMRLERQGVQWLCTDFETTP